MASGRKRLEIATTVTTGTATGHTLTATITMGMLENMASDTTDTVEIHRLMMTTVPGALRPTSSRDGPTVQFRNASSPAPATLADHTTQRVKFKGSLLY